VAVDLDGDGVDDIALSAPLQRRPVHHAGVVDLFGE
jgi:hypothetical protein